jgi:hypothetical protein
VHRLIDPGSEWRLHRQWLEQSAMGDLIGEDLLAGKKERFVSLFGKKCRPRHVQRLKHSSLRGYLWGAWLYGCGIDREKPHGLGPVTTARS